MRQANWHSFDQQVGAPAAGDRKPATGARAVGRGSVWRQPGGKPSTAPAPLAASPLYPARHPPQSVAACLSREVRRILSLMGTKSRETIYGSSVRAAAERAAEARKEADKLACEAWNKRMLGFRGPAQPSPTLGDALNAGYGYLEVKCLGCNTHQTVALDIVRRPKTTPIHELERYMRCKDCSEVRRYPYKRSHLVALRVGKITASDPPSTSVAEGYRRCQFRKRHRGHPGAGKPRRLIASSPKIPHSSRKDGDCYAFHDTLLLQQRLPSIPSA